MTENLNIGIILDIFSGLPNPTWKLKVREIDELKKKLIHLTRTGRIFPPKLGYRGIWVMNDSMDTDIPKRIVAYNNVLSIKEGKSWNNFIDSNKLEQWLLNQAREKGYGEVIEEFLKYGK